MLNPFFFLFKIFRCGPFLKSIEFVTILLFKKILIGG